jgi:hypothetical protein
MPIKCRSPLIAMVAAGFVVVGAFVAPEAARAVANPRLTFTFNNNGYAPRMLAVNELPYALSSPLPLVDAGVHDEFGVRMYERNGVLYDHPVAQAQYGIKLVYSYRLTGIPEYLDRAKAQAQRLVDRAVLSRNAWYFPYPFNFSLHGLSSETRIAPWYSAMAQGQAISFFILLYETTSDPAYLDDATRAFNSFKNLRQDNGRPWIVQVDPSGYLWFEEYPGPGGAADFTLNGHDFAVYGLYDYYRITSNPDARSLWQGGLTTTAHYLEDFRVPGYISYYCLAHHVQSPSYHRVHIGQMLKLYTMTGDLFFARTADALYADFPDNTFSGTAYLSAGVHTGYQFNAAGTITSTRTVTLAEASIATTGIRQTILNQHGVWLKMTDGPFATFWLLESYPDAYRRGIYPQRLTYSPLRTATLDPGTYQAFTYDPVTGAIRSSRTLTVDVPSDILVTSRDSINGRDHLLVEGGVLLNYWLPMGQGVTLT